MAEKIQTKKVRILSDFPPYQCNTVVELPINEASALLLAGVADDDKNAVVEVNDGIK